MSSLDCSHIMVSYQDQLNSIKDARGNPVVQSTTHTYEIAGYTVSVTQHKPIGLTPTGLVPQNPKRFHGPDDRAYGFFPELVRLLPRSASSIVVHSQGEVVLSRICVGQSKFSSDTFHREGASTDEDGEGLEDGLVFDLLNTEQMTRVTQVEVAEKFNGKFAMLGAMRLPTNQVILLVCSKGVHVPVLFDHRHQHKLEQAPRSRLNGQILDCFNRIYDGLSEKTQQEIMNRLCDNLNFLAEFNDNKHLVVYTETHLGFFGIREQQIRSEDEPLASNPVEHNALLRSLGLPTAHTVLMKVHAYLEMRDTLHTLEKVEGHVIRYLDSEGQVVGMAKLKNPWYVLWRMTRQLLIGGRAHQLRTTLEARNQFLKLSPEKVTEWYQKLNRFCNWFLSQEDLTPKHINPGAQENLGFGNILKRFESLSSSELTSFDRAPSVKGMLVVVTGLPGIGKSTYFPDGIERDQFKGQGKKAYMQAVRKAVSSSNTVVSLSSNNSMPREYLPALECAGTSGRICMRVIPEEFTDWNSPRGRAIFWLCLHTVQTREGHPNFPTDPVDAYQVVYGFRERFQVDSQNFSRVITIRYLNQDLVPEDIPSSFPDPKECTPEEIRALMERAKASPGVQNRRTPEEFRKELESQLEECKNLVPQAVSGNKFDYWEVPLKKFTPHLMEVINSRFPEAFDPETQNQYGSHATIITTRSPRWSCRPDYGNQEVTVVADQFLYDSESQALVAVVRIFNADGEDISHIVDSQRPHITLALKKGDRPVKSLEYLKNASSEKFHSFPEPVRMTSSIRLHSAK